MIVVPERLGSPEQLCELLTSLSLAERELLHAICAYVYNPYHLSPPARLVPYSRAFRVVAARLDGGWDDPVYKDLVGLVAPLVESDGWGEFGWGFLQRLCMSLAGVNPLEVWADLLLPLRLVESVPAEWRSAVAEALPELGFEEALALPGLVDR